MLYNDENDVSGEFVNLKNGSSKNQKSLKTKKYLAFALGALVLVFAAVISFNIYASSFTKKQNFVELSADSKAALNSLLDQKYPDERTKLLKNPSFETNANLDVWAGSAILIDASNGNILFEKNADEVIPPASLTKLFVMYLVFEDVASGRFSLDDVVPLP